MAKNMVVGGDYKDTGIVLQKDTARLCTGFIKGINLDKTTVKSYEVLDSSDGGKSVTSAAIRGAVGGALLGPLGLVAGAASAKNKGAHRVVIEFTDGKKSLVEIDDKLYNALVSAMM